MTRDQLREIGERLYGGEWAQAARDALRPYVAAAAAEHAQNRRWWPRQDRRWVWWYSCLVEQLEGVLVEHSRLKIIEKENRDAA